MTMGCRVFGLACMLLACQKRENFPASQPPPTSVPASAEMARPPVQPLPLCEPSGLMPLEAARRFYDEGKFEEALSCASRAQALEPNEPLAHSERAAAFSALGKWEEAQVAYARALALDPHLPDALLGAAWLYGVYLPSSPDHDTLAVVYAERGLALSKAEQEPGLRARFFLVSAMVANDLGASQRAKEHAEWVLGVEPENLEAKFEQALALYELCRFDEAEKAFVKILEQQPQQGHAHHYLGLLLERRNKGPLAEQHFLKARQWAPEEFPPPLAMPSAEFQKLVETMVSALPPDMKDDLKEVPVSVEELPDVADLTAVSPPLSPSILGLFRGPPLEEACLPDPRAPRGAPCRSIVVYRKNLLRLVTGRQELTEQVRVTLLHEIGHLRGEDDHELAARGLE